MSNQSKLAVGVAAATLCLMPCFAQRSTQDVDKVANWPAPLYWQQPAPSGQDNVNGRTTSAQETPHVATGAQLGVAAVFVAITPCRLADTRNSTFPAGFGPPTMTAGQTRVFAVPSGPCGLPATAVAYSFNIAVVPVGSQMRWLTAWPDGETMPTLATLNDKAGLVTSNAAVVAAGNAGAIDIYVEDATDVIIDVNGYYALPANLPFGGTAAAPALTFGNTTTGLYSAGAGELGIAAGGANVATVSSTGLSVPGNLDFGGEITQSGAALLRSSPSTNDVYLGFNENASLAGTANSALGSGALNSLGASATGNTGVGYAAGWGITSGGENVAVGNLALYGGGGGGSNTAVGAGALSNASGMYNTALGYFAGWSASSGGYNTFLGYNTAYNGSSTPTATGSYNTFIGNEAGQDATSGSNNTFVGSFAGQSANSGSLNTFVGSGAGVNATSGSHNIFIGNSGTASPDTESSTIRIGGSFQSRTFIAGISGVTTGLSGALPVVIDSNGQLGTTSSSRRFKTDIADMGDTTETLMSLRPVQFRYTAYGPGAPLQYGLIAEEVAEIAPELVAHNANGEIETVFYDKVNAMLLNQVQTQQRRIEQLESQKERFLGLVSQLESRLAEIESRVK
ncbi:MAG: tail fiber domain-containing protein [Bryobacteraceae bacterium]